MNRNLLKENQGSHEVIRITGTMNFSDGQLLIGPVLPSINLPFIVVETLFLPPAVVPVFLPPAPPLDFLVHLHTCCTLPHSPSSTHSSPLPIVSCQIVLNSQSLLSNQLPHCVPDPDLNLHLFSCLFWCLH